MPSTIFHNGSTPRGNAGPRFPLPLDLSRKLPASKASGDAGFTLLEVLISMLLLTIVMVGLAGLQLTTIRTVTASRGTSEAERLAQSRIERFQGMAFPALPGVQGWTPPLMKDGVTQMTNVGVDGESAGPYSVDEMVEASGTGGTSLVLSVRVSWQEVSPTQVDAGLTGYRTLNVIMSTLRSP